MKASVVWFLIMCSAKGLFAQDSHSALASQREALRVAQQQNEGQGFAYLSLGKAYREAEKFDSALLCFEQAARYFENEGKSQPELIECLDQTATVHEMLGHFDKALDFNQQVLKLREQQNDSTGLATTYNNLGIVYSNLGNFDMAREYYRKSLDYSHSRQALMVRANALNNMAIAFYYEQNYAAALTHYRQALALRLQLGNATKIAESYHNIADVFLNQHKLDSANLYYMDEYALADSLQHAYMKVYALYGLATVAVRNNQLHTGLAYAQHAWALAQQLNILREQSIVSDFLYSTYKQQGRFDSALYFYEQHKRISDSLFNLDKAKAIASLESRAVVEKKELELANEQRVNQQQRNALISLGIALVISLVATIFYSRARKQEKAARKIVEAQKEQIQNQADALKLTSQNKDKLLAIIGHDLRGPIGSLKGLLELVRSGQLTTTEFEDLSTRLRNSVDNLFNLVNHLLQWANTQLKGIKPHPALINLSLLVAENIELLNVIAVKKNIVLVNQFPEAVQAWADANLVNVVLRNLISNALKYTHAQGSVRVAAQVSPHVVAVSISDTGVGMDAETVAKLFSGSLTSATGTSGEKGTGLGLSMCKDFVEQQGGTLTVSSEVGLGSTFTFTLPRYENS